MPSPVLVASHPRSGTHLVIDLLRRQFPTTQGWRIFGKSLDHLYLNIERLTSDNRPFTDEMADRILNRCSNPLMKTHYLQDFSETWVAEETRPLSERWQVIVDNATLIYVHRDPREVMISYKQFLSPSHPEIAEMPIGAFLDHQHWNGRDTMLSWWVRHVNEWTSRRDALVIAYHKLVREPEEMLKTIADHLGLTPVMRRPLLPPKVTSLTRTRFDRLTSLSPSSTAIIGDSKRFQARRWEEAKDTLAKRRLSEVAGQAMRRLGYDPALYKS